jgi:energy-converting hydrogenase Eha subunit F
VSVSVRVLLLLLLLLLGFLMLAMNRTSANERVYPKPRG